MNRNILKNYAPEARRDFICRLNMHCRTTEGMPDDQGKTPCTSTVKKAAAEIAECGWQRSE